MYYGDNLDILRRYIPDESVDLIYLDPPFNSEATYNVLFEEKNGTASVAQIRAFEDTWHWDMAAAAAYDEVVTKGPDKLSRLMEALRMFLGANDMMAYLTMMAIRLIELHRVLKPTGTIYLHCDPTASHYLKLVMDGVFGAKNFLNEVVWCYKERERVLPKWNPKHDILLFYCKDHSAARTFNWRAVAEPYSKVTLAKFKYRDEKGHYQIRGRNIKGSPIRAADGLRPEHEEKYPGLTYRDYLEARPGVPPRDWWQINIINKAAKERLGYPTQKPEALLERVVKASSNEGDLVLDPFCGCGTTLVVAERLKRRWIGIDITHLAIRVMRKRLLDTFGDSLSPFEVIGEPTDLRSAEALAEQDRSQFQSWALSLVDARPYGEGRKGADTGIDGLIYFIDNREGRVGKVVIQVKSGTIGVKDVRDLRGVMEREKAEIGVFITLRNPTDAMRKEAASAGFYTPPEYSSHRYPRLQILTIEDLLNGAKVSYPEMAGDIMFKRAAKAKPRAVQLLLNPPRGEKEV